jgi:hypothetical protein
VNVKKRHDRAHVGLTPRRSPGGDGLEIVRLSLYGTYRTVWDISGLREVRYNARESTSWERNRASNVIWQLWPAPEAGGQVALVGDIFAWAILSADRLMG